MLVFFYFVGWVLMLCAGSDWQQGFFDSAMEVMG